MITVDGKRLLDDLRTLATFGKVGTGVNRLSFSPEDRAAREWLCGRMREAGLEAEIDAVGNVYGRAPATRRTVLLGSHTDTVPNGGWLDGALGVMYGLEIARRWLEVRPGGGAGVDAISFQDEESTYLATLGSRSFSGALSDAELAGARGPGGRPLTETLSEAGYAGKSRARLDPTRHVAYLEGHIEQGPRLETEGIRIGVVTGIVGIRRHQIVFTGRADHAGTTPMDLRQDAGAALVELAHDLLAEFRKAASPNSVWNLGNVVFAPGAANVVPAEARLAVEFRDTDPAILDRFETIVRACVERYDGRSRVRCAATRTLAVSPAIMDARVGEVIREAAARHDVAAMSLPSGAGHDAMILAAHVPTAMLFVPSRGGRSHDVAEDTAEADIVLGANVLMTAVERLLGGDG